jgi:UDP-N-acetylglucosamine 2-epimerase (non-hydrolysing)
VLVHTNQHYAKNLDEVFFKCLELPKPKHNLNIGSGSHGQTTGKMLALIEEKLIEEKPDFVLVQGDTNSVLAGALAAVKLNILVGHIEAGLRSFDRTMPEETNRIIVDHISDYLFVPTAEAENNLLKEGISKNKIYLVGNTVVDVLINHLNLAKKKSNILKSLDLKSKNYILSTIHRQENTSDKKTLANIFIGLEQVSRQLDLPVIIPSHPRLIKTLNSFHIKAGQGIQLVDPVDYLDFIVLEKNAKIIVTDSGGIQEEACILGTPCVTVRQNTERPETVIVKANILAGTSPSKILSSSKKMTGNKIKWKNPFGDGKTSSKILKILSKQN